jgi:hypothetical protein
MTNRYSPAPSRKAQAAARRVRLCVTGRTEAGKSGEIYGEPPETGEGVVVWPSPGTGAYVVSSIPMYWALGVRPAGPHEIPPEELDSAIACAVARSRGAAPVYVINA